MVKKSKFNYWIIPIVLIVILIVAFAIDFLYRTLFYQNHLKTCVDKDSFCGIQVINISLPENYRSKLLEISETKGVRIEIPKKHQKNISYVELKKEVPDIDDWYESLSSVLSPYIDDTLKVVPKDIKTRICLVVYEKEGDYIDWHFDTNHYNGRFFTLLIPVSTESTCGNYVYKDHTEVEQILEVEKSQAIFFEGDKVFHRGKELCANQRRVILSLTFVTDDSMNVWNYCLHKVKELGVLGK
jgi:hypothetical protein